MPVVQNHSPEGSQESAEGTKKKKSNNWQIDILKQLKYVTDTLNQYLSTAGEINHMNALGNKR